MSGCPARLLVAGIAVAATLLTGCTPPADVGERPDNPHLTVPTVAVQESAATPLPAAPDPTTTGTPYNVPPPPAPPLPFALNLYEEGAFVPQYTFDWCVAASIQMAHNLARHNDPSDGTWAGREQQSELWNMARARSTDAFNGANPFGWAAVLTEVGMGPYSVVSIPDYGDALRAAAKALRTTGRPVGLVMWSGRHAWVMSGFESVGDPKLTDDFLVTGIRVLDPLYPYGSGQWGPSPEPGSLLDPGQLAAQFVVREPRRWSSGLPAGYLLVLPLPQA